MKTILKMLVAIWIVPAFGKSYTYGPAEFDNFYDDPSYSDNTPSDVTSNIFSSLAQIGTAYFQSKTPDTVARVPLGTQVNPPNNSAPTQWLLLAVLAVVGFFAYKHI